MRQYSVQRGNPVSAIWRLRTSNAGDSHALLRRKTDLWNSSILNLLYLVDPTQEVFSAHVRPDRQKGVSVGLILADNSKTRGMLRRASVRLPGMVSVREWVHISTVRQV